MELFAAPVSFAQQGLWIQAEMEPGNPAYHVPVALHLRGAIDERALAGALRTIVERHEILRTTFAMQGSELVQLIHPTIELPFRVENIDTDDDELTARIREEIHRPFDLVRGPLLRFILFRRSPDDAVLVGTMHHLITDGWSIGVLMKELTAAYGGEALPELEVQYADFAEWQREQAAEAWKEQVDYWRARLRGPLPHAELPLDVPRTSARSYAGATERLRIPLATLERLRALSNDAGATLFMTLLAAFKVFVYRHTHEADVVVGSPVANRNRPEIEELVGFFVNMQVLRTDLSGAPTFLDALARVRDTTLGAWDHQDVPFEVLTSVLQPERTQAADPFFRVVFALQNAWRGGLDLPRMSIRTLDIVTDTAKLALTVITEEMEDGLDLRMEYSSALFTRDTIQRFCLRFQRLLDEICADPRRSIDELPLLTPGEEELLREWGGASAHYEQGEGLHTWFEATAQRFPDRIAIRCEGVSLTYRELDARANALADGLRARGVGPETLVGLRMERSIEMVVAIFGILKAGGAYVPFDPATPPDRIAYMIEDSGVELVLDGDWRVASSEWRTAGANRQSPIANREHAAYVIYTSGSTGKPKGVIVTHANVMRLMSSTEALYGFDEHDVWTLFHSYAFDFSVWELWGALLYGGCVVVVPYATSRTPEQFLRLLRDERVTVLNQTPSAFYQLMAVDDGGPLALRYVIFGGEALDIPKLKPWFDRRGDAKPQLVNMYGITETTVHVTYRPIAARDAERASSVIGRALADLEALVLDANGALVPIGVAGELYVGGAGVARGYLRRDELTAARFITREGERLYRTGDLVRWLATGELEYLGRIDTQVKVRGFRIELGEIEHVLQSGGDVRDVAVVARDNQRLVAYVVPAPGAAPTPAELRKRCDGQLPDYMVPAAYVLLDAFPLTANGKLDRAALPDPDRDQHAVGETYVAPRNETEEKLARIWADVLQLERVGVEDNFFAVGGDSILLLQIAAKASRAGLKFKRRDLIEHQTIGELARLMSSRASSEGPGRAGKPSLATRPAPSLPLGMTDAATDYPLTPLQEGLLFHSLYAPNDGVYVEQLHGIVSGPLDLGAFERAWQNVILRHAVLRTSFDWKDAGKPLQRVAAEVDFRLGVEDWRESGGDFEAFLLADRKRGFDLATPPLTRWTMIRVADDRWRWLWTHHHLVLDGWCLSHLMSDVLACYRAYVDGATPQLPERRPYRDYIDWLAQQDAAAAEGYWRETMRGFSVPSRIDAPKPAPSDGGAREQDFVLDEAETARLQAWARQAQVTPSTIVTAAWAMLVRAYSGSDDVVFGVTVSGRPAELTGFETMIGPFINTLPLRVRVDAGAPLDAWLRDVQQRHQRMREYEYSRLVDIQRWSDLPAGEPLFDSLMVFENYPVDASLREQQTGLEFSGVTFVERSNYGLALAAIPGEKLTLRLYFDDARFDRPTVKRMLEQLGTLLTSGGQTIVSVHEWSLLPPHERQLVVTTWNDSAADYPQQAVHELFDAQAIATPDAEALVFGDERLTYRELAERADALAATLRDQGVGPEVLVGIQLERSIEMIVAVLAVWKAGGAYVPLDPTYPEKRLQHMISDSGVELMIGGGQTILSVRTDKIACPPPRLATRDTRPANLAYIIYTSGSTGQPKGTLVTHRGLANLAQAQSRAFDVRPGDRVLQFASLSFDASASEIVMALCFGATLHLVRHDDILPGEPFARLLREQRITHLTIPPSVLAAVPYEPLPDLRSLIVAGEACPPALAETWAKGRRFLDAYGPTENSVCATIGEYSGNMLTIGRPMANVRVYILDRRGEPLPIGAAGELHIGGVGVSRGYLGRPSMTAERFIPDPFASEPGARMYRSGDLARWLPDSTIDYLGRIDHQVKIRGHRVELDEIAQVLRDRCALRDAAVLALRAPSGQHRLIAYCATGGRAIAQDELRTACSEWLPEHMVPAAYVVLDELPLTPSGKLDRAALPDPDHLLRESFVPATNETEEKLARVWSQVLGVDRLGIDDNFFALGGDSIVSLQIISRAAKEGLRISPRDIFAHPTVAALARVAGVAGRDSRAASRGEDDGPVPLTPIQRWFFEQELEHPDHWNQAVLVEVAASVSTETLERALVAVGKHHSALRGVVFERIDDDDIASHAARAHASLNLKDGPLARALWFEPERKLLVVIHHLVIDGVSWRILLEDVQRLCEGGALDPATPFSAWARRLPSIAKDVDVAYWHALPRDFQPTAHPENRSGTVRPIELRLTEEETDALLRRVPAVYQTQVNDVLLAALVSTMGGSLWVNLEGHGREPLFDDVDLSRAVGWFTSLFPVRLESAASSDPIALLRSVREQLRRIPQNGVGFGIARYLGSDEVLASLPEPELSFNYLGQLDQGSGGLFRLIDGPIGEGQHPDEERRHLLDVVASVRGRQFRIVWHYSTAVHEHAQIEALANAYMTWLRRLLRSVQEFENVDELYVLTPMQQGLLFHALQANESDLYLEQLHGELRGHLDEAAFERAWQTVIARHAIFRTAFVWQNVDEPLQRVERRVDFELERPTTDLETYLRDDRARGFALDRAPLMRVALIRVADDRWQWVWTHHHILLDGWCLALVIRDVLRAYQGQPLTPTRAYRDYIEWLAQQDGAKAEAYWRRTLGGFTAPTRISLIDESAPDDRGEVELALSADETQRMSAWARRHNLTLNTLVAGAWARVLQTFSGSDDIVFGVTVSGRPPSLAGSDEMIGLFINTLPLRVGSDRGMKLADWLHEIQQQQTELRDYEYSRLVDIQRWSDLPAGEPLFDTLLAFDNYPVDRTLEQRFGEVAVEGVHLAERTHYPMTLSVVPGEAMRMRSLYDPRRFSGAGIRRMLHALRTVLNAVAADGEPLLVDADERAAILSRVASRESRFAEECLHDWFARVAAARGDAIAVTCGDQHISYRELDARANALAEELRARGVGPESLVGLRMERSIEMIVAILGILKAGGAYVPFDPTYPPERIVYMIDDSRVELVLDGTPLPNSPRIANRESRIASSENAAYVIYTSGSTGRPKGCVVTHANVSRLMRQTEGWYGFDERDVWTLFHSVAFDFSVWEIWGALLYGGRLVIVPYSVSRSPEQFRALLAHERVTVLNQTPSAFKQLIAVDEERDVALSLRYVIFGGEALQIDALAPWFARHGDVIPRLVNMYGITETTVHVTYRVITRADLKSGTGSRIGVPIPDLQLYVLDRRQQLVPDGVAGELYVAGAGVARGYLRRPELTAQRMITNPFGEGRLYRTGDLVRWRDDGLEYLGRIDEQVKLRGFRIELGEIESVLMEHPAVREAVVLLKDGRLVAYVVLRDAVTDLRDFAATRLPDYMLPSAFVVLDAMPLTSNGKIDRRALPAHGAGLGPASSRDHIAPRTERERVLAEVWSEVLGVASVGIHDNFFALGGDSIRSIQVLSKARARGVELTFQDLFERPTIAELSDVVPPAEDERTAPFALVPHDVRAQLPDDVEDAYPLTRLQQGMFFHTEAYHDVMRYHLRAPYDRDALVRALAAVAARHPILRTSFDDSLQLVHRTATIPLDACDPHTPFDPTTAPLLRVNVEPHDDGTFHFIVSFHHAILDGWSLASLLTELFAEYVGRASARPPDQDLTFRDFVAMEQRVLADPDERAFWTSYLSEAESTPLPRLMTEERRSVARQEIAIGDDTARALKRLADTLGVPLRSVLLAAHVRALAHITNHDDVVTGLVTNGRPERAGGDRVLGLFLNTVPFRLRVARGSWSELVRETFRTEQQLAPHRRFPLAEIQKARGGAPLFETDFNFVHFHVFDQLRDVDGIESLGAEGFEETNFTVAVNFSWFGNPARLAGTFDYDASQLTREQGELYAGIYASILEAMAADAPWRTTSRLAIRDSRFAESLHDLIAPPSDAIAVAFDEEQLTYAELHRRADELAEELRARGVGPDVLVGVAMESSAARVVALLAILKAGGAYLPIDPSYPAQRRTLMIEDSGVEIVLDGGQTILSVRTDKIVRPPQTHPDNLAYALYTSGSTGRPKGVLIPHRAIVNHMRWMGEAYPLTPDDRVFQKTPFSFDASVWEFWAPLIAGATLWGGRPGGQQDPAYLIETIRTRAITILQVVPTLLELLLDDADFARCTSLRRVFVGGEALTPALVRRFRDALPHAELVNLYGPTEAAIDSTSHVMRADEPFAPIGTPIHNAHAYVLDARLDPVPVGTDGELYIGGAGVGRGYHGNAALTAASFIPDPFSAEPGARLYRTGDLARWLPGGVLEFRGRADEQVKVRGHRIELGEIEAVLATHPAVRRAVAAVVEGRLVAYVTGEPSDDLRSFLAERLPEHMLPSAFVQLDAMPLTPSGKIDRRALPVVRRPGFSPASRHDHVAPSTEAEHVLTEAWQSVLGIERVGIDDNFFELGGDSILSLQIVARARRAGWKIAPRAVLQGQTIARIASGAERLHAIVTESRPSGEVPLLPIQRAFFAMDLANPHHWNQSTLLTTPADFDFDRFRNALRVVVEHHDAFRLRFTPANDGWRQAYVDDVGEAPFERIASRDIEAEANRLQASLNITHGPLIRAAWFESGRLLLVIHHLIVDAVSWRILLDDLAAAYEGRVLTPPSATYLASALASPRESRIASRESRTTERAARNLRVELDAGFVPESLLLAALREVAGEHVDVESHGRDLFEHLDVSRTVGWFTRIEPGDGTADISFNFLGQVERGFEASAFGPAPESAGFDRGPENARRYLIDVTARIAGGKLVVDWTYASDRFSEEHIATMAADFVAALRRRLDDGIEDVLPLTPLQEGLLFHALDDEQRGVYIQQITARLYGTPNRAAFERAWDRVLARHAALRASFRSSSQVIQRHVTCPIEWRDAGEWDELLRDDRQRGFELERAPLMRLTMLRDGDASWRLLWTHHHLILDGWSLPIVLREVLALYNDEALPPAPAYAPSTRWLARRERGETYWRDVLRGFAGPNEISLPRPAGQAGPPVLDELELELSDELTAKLTALAQRARVTLNTVMQALWAQLVATYSGQRDVVFGVTVSGRPAELPDVEQMVGLFINTLPLRVDTGASGEPLTAFLQGVQERQAAMSQHETSRLVDVQAWSGHRSLFETVFVFENYPLGDAIAAPPRDFTVSDVRAVEWTHYPLTCFVIPAQRLRLKLVYQTARFSRGAMEGVLAHGEALAFAMASGDWRLAIGGSEYAFNETFEENALDVPVHERFRAQAKRTPDRTAVVSGEQSLTYRELDERSDTLARRLGNIALAGISMERSVDMMVALLAVLKAGAAYLPLDPRFPQERLRMMVEDAQPDVIITSEGIEPRPANRQSPIAHRQLAYVIFTSGSTGRPKGVEIPHRALANVLATFARRPGLAEDDVLVAVTTLSFDIAALELFLPLTTGAKLVIAGTDDAADGERLAALLARERATVMQATPATWRLLLTSGWTPTPSLRMWCGGEAMPPDLAEGLLVGEGELWNVYGPTETTIWSAIARVRSADDARFLGFPIGNTTFHVVDDRLQPVPDGVPGELLIGGAGVARGYLGRPDLTAERFVPHGSARLYRTGDRIRITEDGRLEFLGRIDTQVKIRGFRVELGEIEAALRRDRDIRDAAVAVIDGQRLAAYLVLGVKERRPDFVNELTTALRERLPEYMVPGIYVDLDALPLTPNGKVDRKALPRPDAAADADYVAPRNALEDVLADLWRQALGVARVGVRDDFFALGGHSLHVAQIVTSLRQSFQVRVPLRGLFEAPTVERLAEVLVSLETQPGRTQQIAAALLQIRNMSPEERARRLEARRAREQRPST